jgi:hypothetical protein
MEAELGGRNLGNWVNKKPRFLSFLASHKNSEGDLMRKSDIIQTVVVIQEIANILSGLEGCFYHIWQWASLKLMWYCDIR